MASIDKGNQFYLKKIRVIYSLGPFMLLAKVSQIQSTEIV